MVKVNALLTNFTAGELSPRLDVRVDIGKYRNGLKTLQNGIVMPHGGLRKRPGTVHVAEVKNSANAVRLVPFEFNTEQAYVLEFGPTYVRFYTNNGQLESGGSPVEVTTTYSAAQLDALSFAQSADTLFIAHAEHPIRKLTRTSATTWTLTEADIENGPFRTINTDKTHYLSVAVTGSASISGATQAEPVVITATAHGFSEGATVSIASVGGMTQLNGNKYQVRNVTDDTFELWSRYDTPIDGAAYTAYTSGGTATIATTAFGTISPGSTVTLTSSDDLFTSDHVGALFRLWEPGKGTGVAVPVPGDTSDTSNNLNITNDGKVYGMAEPGITTEYLDQWSLPTHDDGAVNISGKGGDGNTYSYYAVFLHDISCVLEITAVASATSATARVVRNHIPKSIIDEERTNVWEEGAWSGERGYPGEITFFEQRLWAAGSTAEPQKIWASKSGSFEDFQDGADDDAAIIYEIASNKVDVIRWLSPGKVLVIGTASGEYAAAASSRGEALTPSNARITKQTPYGVSGALPVQVANATIFVQRYGKPSNEGRKIREFAYSFESDNFVAPDLTIISEHITNGGIDNLVYQQSPDSVLWSARGDGQLPGMTYEREQEVTGWHRAVLGGTGVDVESMAVIPGTYGDELWLAVKRTVDGGTVRYVEYMHPGLQDDDDKQDGVYVDSALTYSGSATATITGLDHLEGETVDVLGDGFVQKGLTVSSGSITLSEAVSEATVGLPYTTIIETLELEGGLRNGSARGQPKRIGKIKLELYRSMGGRYGRNAANMNDILYRDTGDSMGTTPDLYTGLIDTSFDSGWSEKPIVRLEHDDPLPFSVLGIVEEQEVTG